MISLWIVGGCIALCGALCYGELSAAIPYAGGEYIFLSKLYNPLAGFLSGWVSFIVGFSAPIAASAIGFSEYFVIAFPQIGNSIGISNPIIIKKSLSLVVLIGFTFIRIREIEFGTIIQNYLTVLKIGLIIGLIFIGFPFGHGDFGHFKLNNSLSFGFSS